MKFLTPGSSATTLTWSGASGPQVALTDVGSHLLEGHAQVVLVVPQCELGIAVGVGNWFSPFQFSQQGVVNAPVAQC